jgi:hypothetical protein
MHKAMITKAFVGSRVGFAGAVVLFLLRVPVIGIHRRDGKRLPPPASPDTQPRFALLNSPSEGRKPEALRASSLSQALAGRRVA